MHVQGERAGSFDQSQEQLGIQGPKREYVVTATYLQVE